MSSAANHKTSIATPISWSGFPKAALLAFTVTLGSPLFAQEYDGLLEKYNETTSGGVNMLDGMPQWNSTDLVVDAESPVPILVDRSLVLNPRYQTGINSNKYFSIAFNWNFVPQAQRFPNSETFGYAMTFNWAGQRIVFDKETASDPWQNHYQSGETFIDSGSNLTLILRDGGEVYFEESSPGSTFYRATKYLAPNNDFLIFSYGNGLTRVQNSRGHGIDIHRVPSNVEIESIDAVRTYCESTTYQSCEVGALPTVSYTYDSYQTQGGIGIPPGTRRLLASYQDGTGVTYGFEYEGPNALALSKVRQLSPTPVDLLTFTWSYFAGDPTKVTATTDAEGNVSQYVTGPNATRTFPDGGVLDLGYGARMETPAKSLVRGGWLQFHALGRNPQPRLITDQLGRLSSRGYDLRGRLIHEYLPGGLKREFTLDDRGNRTAQELIAAQPSSLPNLVNQAVFPACTTANRKVCNQPSSETDPNGNTTTFEYSTVHGGIISKTQPAVDGVNPRTTYSYASRTAYYQDDNGQMVAAPDPLWLLASEQFCRTSSMNAAGDCGAGPSDKVVTNYEYSSPNPSGPSNIVLVGTAVTADGTTLRTCFGYDVNGRRISETQPNANLASCQ